jgi:hypothetical protein
MLPKVNSAQVGLNGEEYNWKETSSDRHAIYCPVGFGPYYREKTSGETQEPHEIRDFYLPKFILVCYYPVMKSEKTKLV